MNLQKFKGYKVLYISISFEPILSEYTRSKISTMHQIKLIHLLRFFGGKIFFWRLKFKIVLNGSQPDKRPVSRSLTSLIAAHAISNSECVLCRPLAGSYFPSVQKVLLLLRSGFCLNLQTPSGVYFCTTDAVHQHCSAQ